MSYRTGKTSPFWSRVKAYYLFGGITVIFLYAYANASLNLYHAFRFGYTELYNRSHWGVVVFYNRNPFEFVTMVIEYIFLCLGPILTIALVSWFAFSKNRARKAATPLTRKLNCDSLKTTVNAGPSRRDVVFEDPSMIEHLDFIDPIESALGSHTFRLKTSDEPRKSRDIKYNQVSADQAIAPVNPVER